MTKTLALAGKRVVVTRPRAQAASLAQALQSHGAVPILFPTIEIAPTPDTAELDRAIDALADFDWVVFTSVNGVSMFADRLAQRGGTALSPSRVAAIGPATADELRRRGVEPAFMPTEFVADRIPEGLGDLEGRSVLLPRAARARKDLARELERLGARVVELSVYHTISPEPDPTTLAELGRGVDALMFTSSSTVEHFVHMTGDQANRIAGESTVACIGPITARTAARLGIRVDVVAEPYTTEGLVAALVKYFSQAQTPVQNP